MQLTYVVERGKETGCVLTPHRYRDGSYAAGRDRYATSHIHVRTLRELIDLYKRGYPIRMSNPNSSFHRGPSLIHPARIRLT